MKKEVVTNDKTETEKYLKLGPETTCQRKIFLYDHISVLNILMSLMVKNLPVLGLILKHNDSNTVRFIIRNIFFILALFIDPKTRKIHMMEST